MPDLQNKTDPEGSVRTIVRERGDFRSLRLAAWAPHTMSTKELRALQIPIRYMKKDCLVDSLFPYARRRQQR